MFSGTIKFEDGSYAIIDNSKAEFIKEKFKDYKIGIFYKFVAELEMLKSVFGNQLTTDLDEFNANDKNIALQIVSGREGISLAQADYLVFMNIDFSAVSYFQARDRLTTMQRKENTIFWIFSKNGIEEKIYKTVQSKKIILMTYSKKILEQQIQTKIIKKLEKEGYYVIKLIKTNVNGIPDLIAIKENETIFIEVKRPDGVLSELQKVRIKELRNRNIKVKVLCGVEQEFKELKTDLKSQQEQSNF